MAACDSRNLSLQVNATLDVIKEQVERYLKEREHRSFDEMKETWALHHLDVKNPNYESPTFVDRLHERVHAFYVKLKNYQELIKIARNDNIMNKSRIAHDEDTSVDIILDFFTMLTNEIEYTINETENFMEHNGISKPSLAPMTYEIDANGRKRDFLIAKELIEDLEKMKELLDPLCDSS